MIVLQVLASCICNINYVITVFAEGLTPGSAKPSAHTGMTTKLDIFFPQVSLGINDIILYEQRNLQKSHSNSSENVYIFFVTGHLEDTFHW